MKQSGFTLIELMITLVIVAVLTATAIPSYQRYLVRNAESDAKDALLSVSVELERQRVRTLSYAKFVPEDRAVTDNRFFVGGEGTASDYMYEVELLVNAGTWRMFAEPNQNNTIARNGRQYLLTSAGEKCASESSGSDLSINGNCSENTENWN